MTIHQSMHWNWDCISKNPGITIEDILDNRDKDWEWDCMSQNSGITMIDINGHPELPWNWFWISQRVGFYRGYYFILGRDRYLC